MSLPQLLKQKILTVQDPEFQKEWWSHFQDILVVFKVFLYSSHMLFRKKYFPKFEREIILLFLIVTSSHTTIFLGKTDTIISLTSSIKFQIINSIQNTNPIDHVTCLHFGVNFV